MGNTVRQSNMTRGGGNIGSGRRVNNMNPPPQLTRPVNSRHSDYQLKVGGKRTLYAYTSQKCLCNDRSHLYTLGLGVVVGSWAGGVPNKPIGGGYLRYPRAGIINGKRRGTPQHMSVRNHRVGMGSNPIVARALSRNMYAGKVHKNRKQRRTKDKKLSLGNEATANIENGEPTVSDDVVTVEQTAIDTGTTEELSNGYVSF